MLYLHLNYRQKKMQKGHNWKESTNNRQNAQIYDAQQAKHFQETQEIQQLLEQKKIARFISHNHAQEQSHAQNCSEQEYQNHDQHHYRTRLKPITNISIGEKFIPEIIIQVIIT